MTESLGLLGQAERRRRRERQERSGAGGQERSLLVPSQGRTGEGVPSAPAGGRERSLLVPEPQRQPQQQQEQEEQQPLDFRQRPARAGGMETDDPLAGIEGFRGQPRTDNVLDNTVMEFKELGSAYMTLGSMLFDDPVSTVKTVGANLPAAFVESFTRWHEAWERGQFMEALQRHPVQFVQDMSLPLALFTGGVSGIAKVAGTGATAGRVAAASQKIARAADMAGIATDPIGGTGVALARAAAAPAASAVTAEVARRVGRRAAQEPRYRMPIDSSDADPPTPPLGQRIEQNWRSFQTSYIDANYPLAQLGRRGEQARIAGESGDVVSRRRLIDSDLEERVRTFSGVERKIKQVLDPDRPTTGGGQRTYEGFNEPDDITRPIQRDPDAPEYSPERTSYRAIFEEAGEMNLRDIREYAVARRAALDLEPRGLEHGADVNEARSIVSAFDPQSNPNANPDIHQAWSKWRQFSDDRLTYYQRSGLISEDMKQAWRRDNPNYVPFTRTDRVRVRLTPDQAKRFGVEGGDEIELQLGREGEGMQAVGVGGTQIRNPQQIIRRFNGSQRMLQDPIEADYVLTSRMMREAELNQIMSEVAKLAEIEGSGVRFAQAPEGISSRVTSDELQRTLELEGVLDEAGDGALTGTRSPVFQPRGMPDNMGVWIQDGQRRFLEFDDPDIAQSIASMRFSPGTDFGRWGENVLTGSALRLGRSVARLQRAGVTLEPGFTLGLNVLRDTTQAWSYSNYGFKPVYDNIRGLYHYLNRGEVFDMWARSGGMQAHLAALDRPALRKSISEWVRSGSGRTAAARARDRMMHPVRFLQALQEVSEATTRLGEFNRGVRRGAGARMGERTETALARAREEGRDVTGAAREASVASRDVAVDFSRRGSDPVLRAWNSMTAFQNAQIQSMDLFRRKWAEGSVAQRGRMALRTTLGMTIPSMYLYARNLTDPEAQDAPRAEKDLFWRTRLYDNAADQFRYGTNLTEPPPEGGTLIRIPKPHEVGVLFGSLPERAMDDLFDQDPRAFGELMERIRTDMLMPLSLPTIVRPIAEIKTGENFFFDAPLEPQSQQRLVKSMRSMSSTSEFSKVLSTLMADEKGDSPLSPIEIDHMLGSYGGTMARGALDATNRPIQAMRGRDVEEPAPRGSLFERAPVINRLIANPSERSQPLSDAYEVMGEDEKVLNTVRSLEFDGTAEERREFAQDNRAIIAAAKDRTVSRAKRNLMKLGRASQRVRLAPSLTAQRKRELLDNINRQRNRVAKQILERREQIIERVRTQ